MKEYQMRNRLMVAAMTIFTFAVASTGTLAHAENAWKRSRAEKRLAESHAQNPSLQTAKQVQSVLKDWGQYGEMLETVFADEEKLGALYDRTLEKRIEEVDQLTETELNGMRTQFNSIAKSAKRLGNVALAEKFEASINTSDDSLRDRMKNLVRDANREHLVETTLTEIEEAGSVKAYLEEAVVKSTNSWSWGDNYSDSRKATAIGQLKIAFTFTVIFTVIALAVDRLGFFIFAGFFFGYFLVTLHAGAW